MSPNQNFTTAENQAQERNIKNSRLFVFITISVLLTATVVGLSVYLWQKSANERAIHDLEQKISYLEREVSRKKKTEAKLQSSPPPIPSPPTAPAIDWQTCSNSKLGFSIKYPPDFEFNPDTCEYAIMNYDFVKNINVANPLDDFRKNWLLTVTAEESNLTAEQWITSKNLCPPSLCSKRTAGPIANSIELNIKAHYPSIDVITKVDDRIFNFSLGSRNPRAFIAPDIRDIYYQILSTLKFMK